MGDERRDGNGRRHLDDLTNRVGSVEEGQGRVFDLLIGPEELQMDGTMKRKTEEGMDYKVDWMYEQERNGGLHVRLTTRDRVLVVAAFLSASGAVIAALVS
jgi:predicted alpha-1,6-mannanase (GH76 family)